MPNTDNAAPPVLVGELEAIPVLGANLLARPASGPAIDPSNDILCRKGTATSSRWRGYDHKDSFEPAQAATAPPSDADVMGSWVKYDGAAPVATPLDQAVRDEELPTSWTKYDEKPLASLLEPREKPRSKAPIYLAEAAPPQSKQEAPPEIPALPNSLDKAEPQPAPQPTAPVAVAPPLLAEAPTPEAVHALNAEPEAEAEAEIEAEIPAAPVEEAAAEAAPAPAAELPEVQTADSIELPSDASEEAEASAALPVEIASTPMPEVEPAPPPSLPSTAELPDRPEAANAEFPTLSDEAEEPAAEIAEAAPVTEAEPAPALSAEQPPVAAAPAEPIAASLPLEALPPSEALVEPEVFAPAASAHAPEPAAIEPDVETRAAASVLETPTEPAAAGTEPNHQRELLEIAVSAIKKPGPVKKAMLTRLAGMLELALSAKRSARAADQPRVVSGPEAPAPNSGSAEISAPAAAQSEAFAPLEPAGPLPEVQTPPEATEPVAPEVEADAAVPDETEAIDAVPLATTADADTIEFEAITPPALDGPMPDAQTPPQASEPAAPEVVADAVVAAEAAIDPIPLVAEASATVPEAANPVADAETATAEAAALESAPPDSVAATPTLDLDEPSLASVAPPETVGLAEPIPAGSDEVAAGESEPPTEPKAPTALHERFEAAETAALLEPPIEQADVSSTPMVAEEVADTAPQIANIPELPPSEELSAPEPVPSAPESPFIETEEQLPRAPAMVSAGAEADEPPSLQPAAEPEASPAVATAGAPLQEPAREPTAEATSPVFAEQPETSVSPEEVAAANLEPPPAYTHEQSTTAGEAVPQAPSAEDPVPLAADGPAHPAGQAVGPQPEAAAPIEAAPVTESVAAEAAPAPVAPAADPVDPEKAARDALASDLADMIHNVLSTTQFATKAMKPDRSFSVRPVQAPEPEALEDGGEIAADALPHPVAIRSRLGRMERTLAIASLGMMILVGYFALSLWRDDGVVAAQAPVIAPAALSPDRSAGRALGAATIDASRMPPSLAYPGSPDRR